jgi:hypothetical protein
MAHANETSRRRHLPRRIADRRPALPARAAPSRPPEPYDRRRELARVLPLWPHELEDDSAQGRARIVGKLISALRAERRRGVAGHWTYDLARHRELLRVYRLELAASGVVDIARIRVADA